VNVPADIPSPSSPRSTGAPTPGPQGCTSIARTP
jgi:hypothetical protein